MKKHLSLFVCRIAFVIALISCNLGIMTICAQDGNRESYVPFVEEGKIWYCGYTHTGSIASTPEDPSGRGIDCIFTMCGDSLINDKIYKKVYCQFKKYYNDEEQHYYCAVREENYCVYIIEEETMEEKLIYDFSRPEEILRLTYNDYMYGRGMAKRRRGFLPGQYEYSVCTLLGDDLNYSWGTGVWVDGIGAALENPFAFESLYTFYEEPKLGEHVEVRSCMKDGEYVYIDDWRSAPTEPITSVDEKIHFDNSMKDYVLFDLQGRRLSDKPSKGVYIQNGKKLVIK